MVVRARWIITFAHAFLLKASRVLTGPEIVGSRPVVVTFETFRYFLDLSKL